MTQEPRQELEVQGRAGEPVALPVGVQGDTAYAWTLELPDGVRAAGTRAGWLLVRADEPGSHVLVAVLADPSSPTPMTVLPIRLTAV